MQIIVENELIKAVEDGTFIKDGKNTSCEGIKYDFTLSKIALTAALGKPCNIGEYKENAVIKPGEIAFVMTEEELRLPNDIYCQLSASAN
jgi:deoxycytidine triphosphate deaminase